MPEKYLLLYLDAPIQSWGFSSRFNRRTTASWPTKSGIIGMLCAALGIKRDDEAGIARLASLAMRVFTLKCNGIRLFDYHTVGGGYDVKTQRQSMSNKAGGGAPTTVLTDREYMLDSKFGVVLSGDREVLAQCAAALDNPRWGVWFGRKCCLPAARICEGLFDNEKDAHERLEKLAGEHGLGKAKWRIVTEVDCFEDGTDTINDIPVNFSTRQFTARRICDEVME